MQQNTFILATGDILSCPATNLFGGLTKNKCTSVTPPESGPGDSFGQSIGTSPTGDINVRFMLFCNIAKNAEVPLLVACSIASPTGKMISGSYRVDIL